MTIRFTPLVALGGALVAAAALGAFAASHRPSPEAPVAPAATPAAPPVAGPGRVEPLSEEVQVAAQVAGRLQSVRVEEGDAVEAGAVLAVISHDDIEARIASSEAVLAARLADLRRVVNGARPEERLEAGAAVREAEATFAHATADHGRRRGLYQEQVISREEMDRADQTLAVAASRLEAARQRQALLEAAAREEDQARAEADVALARAQLREARALFDKTVIRAPISGVVLHRHLKTGEMASAQADAPVVTLADRSRVRVRVDVDESDVGRVHVGDAVYVTAPAFATRRFEGRVVRIGQRLGHKNVWTDQPNERIDQKVLETLVELVDGRDLPVGLRVQAFIVAPR